MEQPRAQVREIDGQLVLDDPVAVAVIAAVNKHNCRATFEANAERIAHFVRRAEALPAPLLMVILNVDDPLAGELAAFLMPAEDALWRSCREQGLKPIARGLVLRAAIQLLLDGTDKAAGDKLRSIVDCLPVVVMDYGVIEVFRADGR